MSAPTPRSLAAEAMDACVAVAWAQWSALTGAAAGDAAWSIVDPEALVLVSLAGAERERRLTDVLAGWTLASSTLLSVQRMTSLAKRFPAEVRDGVADVATWAVAGGDARWARLAAGRTPPETRGKRPGALDLAHPAALMLRLRAGFGVGAKADVLAMLLGMRGAPARVAEMAAATGYSVRATRAAADEMARARLVHALPGTPAAYRADVAAWAPLLGVDAVAPWRPWSLALPFLLDVAAWGRVAEGEGWSPYVASSRARDLAERHAQALRHTGWPVPHEPDARGEAYLPAFGRLVRFVAAAAVEGLAG